MEKNITAAKFYNLFVESCKEDSVYGNEDLFTQYQSNTTYTEVVNRTIIHDIISKKLGLKTQFEYFRIDVIGWKSRYEEVEEQAKQLGMKAHLWDLEIAVEHENDKSDWNDEVLKLVHIKCPLKVIIGYNYCDKRDDEQDGDFAKLKFVAECMKKTNAFDYSEKEEYLVILGNGGAKGSGTYSSFEYRGYLFDYKKGQFVRVG